MSNQINILTTFQEQSYDVKKVFTEFAKPIISNIFFLNLMSLRLNSEYINFSNDKWIQKPYVFCNDVYSEQYLYPVVLLVNNIRSFLEFQPENFTKVTDVSGIKRVIIAPTREEIRRVLNFV